MATYNFVGNRYWGHDYVFRPAHEGLTGSLSGWHNPLPCKGDILQIVGPSGGPSPYRVVSVRYPDGPPDMFFADVEYLPVEQHEDINWQEYDECLERLERLEREKEGGDRG